MQKSLKINFIMNFILTVSGILFPLVTFPYISRILGPLGTGNVAMSSSLITYFTMVAMLGVPTYGVRCCAQVRDNKEELSKVVQELLIINLIMSIVAYLALFITIFLVPEFYAMKTLYIITSSAIALNVIGVNWFYQGIEEYSYITIASMIFKFLAFVLMFVFVKNSNDYVLYAGVSVIGSFGSGAINFIRLKKYIRIKPIKNYNLKRHFKPIFTFFAMTVATTIYTNLDIVMLGVIKDNYEVGLYNSAVKIKSIMATLISSLGVVMLPRLSYYFEEGKTKELNSLIIRSLSFVILLSVPCCLFLMVYAKDTILFIAGSQFVEASSTIITITPTIVFIGLSNLMGMQILVPTGREKLVLKSVIYGAIVDFLLNLLLIPKLGSLGAAVGTLNAELVVVIIQFWYLKDLIKVIIKKIEFKCLIISILPALLVLIILCSHVDINPFINLLIGGISFFTIYVVGLIMTKEVILTSLLQKYIR